jgi:hypothetical protein
MTGKEAKACTRCGRVKPLGEFYGDKRASDGCASECKKCTNARNKARRERDPELTRQREQGYCAKYRRDNRERYLARQQQRDWEIRKDVLDYYGGKCACCGSISWLTVDHVYGDGRKKRQELPSHKAIYQWLRSRGYPSGYQVLCSPCNRSKGDGLQCRIDHRVTRIFTGLGWPTGNGTSCAVRVSRGYYGDLLAKVPGRG